MELIEGINAEYALYRSNNSRSPQFLQNQIQTFAEDLASQLMQEHHINEAPAADELELFEDQKIIYRKVYEAFIRSGFPYTDQQMSLLHSYRYHLDYASGNPEDEVDVQLINDLKGLLDSMADNEHIDDDAPHRFYIDCTIEHHAHTIIERLDRESSNERTRAIPHSIPDGTTINIATLVSERLSVIFGTVPSEEPRQLFHDGLREVYYRILNIFRNSDFPYTSHQNQLLLDIQGSIHALRRTPNTADHEDLHLQFYGFMDALRRERPLREVIRTNGFFIFDPNGVISRPVEQITWDLIHLEGVAEKHFRSFPLYIERIPNLADIITRYFLRFYPESPMAISGRPPDH